MKKETLQRANELQKLIAEHESALNCFEWDANMYENHGRAKINQLPPRILSTNPKLIIEYDGDGREQQFIPMVLSDQLIEMIKQSIKYNLSKLQEEFDSL